MGKKIIYVCFLWALFVVNGASARSAIKLEMDCLAEPAFSTQLWCQKAKVQMIQWYPRFRNLMDSKRVTSPEYVEVVFSDLDNRAPAMTLNGRIDISRAWASKNPEDIGLAIHELIHVMQDYKGYGPLWITEGIADYYRWVVFEGKPLEWFPIKGAEYEGYRKSYRYAAGFLFWLESGSYSGIIKRLHKAMRQKRYSDQFFEKLTGKPLSQLWEEYYYFRVNNVFNQHYQNYRGQGCTES